MRLASAFVLSLWPGFQHPLLWRRGLLFCSVLALPGDADNDSGEEGDGLHEPGWGWRGGGEGFTSIPDFTSSGVASAWLRTLLQHLPSV